jgi:hypothetical protein
VYGAPPPPGGNAAADTGPTLSKGLSGTLQGFLWATAGFAVIAAPVALATLVNFNDYWDTPVGSRAEAIALDDFANTEDTMVGLQGGMWLSWIVAWILMIIWANSAHKTTQRLGAGDRQWSSGWTVGGWFIPVANLIIPKLVITEIEQIAGAPRRNGRVDAEWRRRPAAAIGWVWWVLMMAGLVAVGIGMALVPDVTEEFSADTVRASYLLRTVGFALVAGGGVCGALYVRRISNRLSSDGLAAG